MMQGKIRRMLGRCAWKLVPTKEVFHSPTIVETAFYF